MAQVTTFSGALRLLENAANVGALEYRKKEKVFLRKRRLSPVRTKEILIETSTVDTIARGIKHELVRPLYIFLSLLNIV